MLKNLNLLCKLLLLLSAIMLLISQGIFTRLWADKHTVVHYKQMPILNADNVIDTSIVNSSIVIKNNSHHIYQFYRKSWFAKNSKLLAPTEFFIPTNGTVLLPGQQFVVGIANGPVASANEQFWLRDLSSSINIHFKAQYQYVGRASETMWHRLKLTFAHSAANSLAPNGNTRFDYLPKLKYTDDTRGTAAPGSGGTYFRVMHIFAPHSHFGSNNHFEILDANIDESNGIKTQQPPELSAPHRFYYCFQSDCHLAYRVKIASGSLNANVNYGYTHTNGSLNINHYSIAMLPYRASLVDAMGKRQEWLVPLAPGLLFQRSNDNVSLSTLSEFVVLPNGNRVQNHSLASAQLRVSQQLDAYNVDNQVVSYTTDKNGTRPTGVIETSAPLLLPVTDKPVNESVSHLYTLLTSNTDKLYDNGEQQAKLGVVLCRVVPTGGKCADPVPQDSPLYNDIYFTYSDDNDLSTMLVTNAYKAGGTVEPVLIESASNDNGISKHYTTEYPAASNLLASVNPIAKSYYFSVLPSKSTSATHYVLHANLCEADNTGQVQCADSHSEVAVTALPATVDTFKAIPGSGADKVSEIVFNQPLTCLTKVTDLIIDKADYLPTYRLNIKVNVKSTVVGAIRGVINYFDPTSANGTLTCDSSNSKHLVRVNSNVSSIYSGDIRAVDKAGNYYHGVLYPK